MSTGGNNTREQLTDSSEHSSFYSPLIRGTAIGCELRVTSDLFLNFQVRIISKGGDFWYLGCLEFQKIWLLYVKKKQHDANWNRAETVYQLLSVNSSRLSEVRFAWFFLYGNGCQNPHLLKSVICDVTEGFDTSPTQDCTENMAPLKENQLEYCWISPAFLFKIVPVHELQQMCNLVLWNNSMLPSPAPLSFCFIFHQPSRHVLSPFSSQRLLSPSPIPGATARSPETL